MMEDKGMARIEILIPKNRPGIADASQLRGAEADFTALRLVELQCSPVRGGFDSAHLQDIHRHLYQDLYGQAGELRKGTAQSLDTVLDRLRAEDLLKGRGPAAWAARSSDYIQELTDLRPFPGGNSVALREFASELASKNQLGLAWDQVSAAQQQEIESANLRRLVMLAMDKDPSPHRPSRGHREHPQPEREAFFPEGTP